MGGIARDGVNDRGLQPDRERDRHLFGVPASNVDRVEYRMGSGPWEAAEFVGEPRNYERAFSVRVRSSETVSFRAWDTAGNTGPEVQATPRG
jgi:hypothetical protein